MKIKYLIGAKHKLSYLLQHDPAKDREWFCPFVTRKGSDDLHVRIKFVISE